MAWLNLREELPKRSGDNTKELEKAKRELIKTAQGYKACAASFTKESQDLKDEIAQMIAVQPQLEALFSQ